jgi:hypothetical protein
MKKLIALSCLCILLTQCVPSIHPLYTEKDLVLDDRLVGKWWEGKDADDRWNFTKLPDKEKGYLLELTQKDGKQFVFEAHLVKLGEEYYLDFLPHSSSQELSSQSVKSYFPEDFYTIHFIPAHTFAKVLINNNSVEIRLFDSEWIDKLIREGKIRIKHESVGELQILTASTAELQKFILKYGQDESAFSEKIKLERIL